MKPTHVCATQTTFYLFALGPSFPSLANEIDKPRPDMNIKVAAFKVIKKSINTLKSFLHSQGSDIPW